jgi:YbgC/YbaW family acyl-CoA thioester hydrolase
MHTFHTQRRVDFCDTDMAGIVHFSNFFRYMEAAEVAFLHSRGLSVCLDWEGQRLGFPRVSASCDYKSPARFEDVLDIAVRIATIGRKSITYACDFSRQGVAVASGRVTSVCCRTGPEHQLLEAIEIPESLRKVLLGNAET